MSLRGKGSSGSAGSSACDKEMKVAERKKKRSQRGVGGDVSVCDKEECDEECEMLLLSFVFVLYESKKRRLG